MLKLFKVTCFYSGITRTDTIENDTKLEMFKVAICALKKQIPMVPIVWEEKHYFSPTPNDDWGYECPCCGNRGIDYLEHHCECGQALNWDYINI